MAGFISERVAGFTLESLGLSWVALEGPRHRHERDAAQAGLNEAAGREFRRLWELRRPQACPIHGKVAGVYGQIEVKQAGTAGYVCNSSVIVAATPIAA